MTINYLEEITELYCLVSVGESGEGIISQVIDMPHGPTFIPFVCADKDRMESLKPLAKDIAKDTGKKIRLIRLTNREVIEDL